MPGGVDDLVDLYRAVGVREFESVTSTRQFVPGGGSLEGRQFALSFDEALKFADGDPSKVAILRATVERRGLDGVDFYRDIDPHIFKHGVFTVQPGTQSQQFHQSLRGVFHEF